MKNQVQPHHVCGPHLQRRHRRISSPPARAAPGLLGGVHLLPFFYQIDGADAGFDPIDHVQVDPRLGTWDDLRQLGQIAEITADLIVNHISALSSQFQEFSRHGDAPHFAGLFLTLDRVFPQGAPVWIHARYRDRGAAFHAMPAELDLPAGAAAVETAG